MLEKWEKLSLKLNPELHKLAFQQFKPQFFALAPIWNKMKSAKPKCYVLLVFFGFCITAFLFLISQSLAFIIFFDLCSLLIFLFFCVISFSHHPFPSPSSESSHLNLMIRPYSSIKLCLIEACIDKTVDASQYLHPISTLLIYETLVDEVWVNIFHIHTIS